MIFLILLDLTSDFVLWWYFCLLNPFRFHAVMLLPITWWYFWFCLILLLISCCDDTSVCLIPSDFTPWCYFQLLDNISDSAWSYFQFRAVMILLFAWSLPISCCDATSDYLMIFPIPLDLTSDFVLWWYFRLLDSFRFRAMMLLPITWWYFWLFDPTSDFMPWCYFQFAWSYFWFYAVIYFWLLDVISDSVP